MFNSQCHEKSARVHDNQMLETSNKSPKYSTPMLELNSGLQWLSIKICLFLHKTGKENKEYTYNNISDTRLYYTVLLWWGEMRQDESNHPFTVAKKANN